MKRLANGGIELSFLARPLCKILPLTHLNDAMRNVAFEGAHLSDCGPQLGVLAIWGVVSFAIAIKVFKWE